MIEVLRDPTHIMCVYVTILYYNNVYVLLVCKVMQERIIDSSLQLSQRFGCSLLSYASFATFSMGSG